MVSIVTFILSSGLYTLTNVFEASYSETLTSRSAPALFAPTLNGSTKIVKLLLVAIFTLNTSISVDVVIMPLMGVPEMVLLPKTLFISSG